VELVQRERAFWEKQVQAVTEQYTAVQRDVEVARASRQQLLYDTDRDVYTAPNTSVVSV
jgi:hypothetical protein